MLLVAEDLHERDVGALLVDRLRDLVQPNRPARHLVSEAVEPLGERVERGLVLVGDERAQVASYTLCAAFLYRIRHRFEKRVKVKDDNKAWPSSPPRL